MTSEFLPVQKKSLILWFLMLSFVLFLFPSPTAVPQMNFVSYLYFLVVLSLLTVIRVYPVWLTRSQTLLPGVWQHALWALKPAQFYRISFPFLQLSLCIFEDLLLVVCSYFAQLTPLFMPPASSLPYLESCSLPEISVLSNILCRLSYSTRASALSGHYAVITCNYREETSVGVGRLPGVQNLSSIIC